MLRSNRYHSGPCCPLPPESFLGFHCFVSPQSTSESQNMQNDMALWSSYPHSGSLRTERAAGGSPPLWSSVIPCASRQERSTAHEWEHSWAMPVIGLVGGRSKHWPWWDAWIFPMFKPWHFYICPPFLCYNELTPWSHLIPLDTCEWERRGLRWECGSQRCPVTSQGHQSVREEQTQVSWFLDRWLFCDIEPLVLSDTPCGRERYVRILHDS